MKEFKALLNESLIKIFNQILMNEETSLHALIGNDISMRDIHIIEAIDSIANSDIATAGNVAKELGVTPGTLTVAIKRLENKNYVTRTTDTKDKRFVTLSLTDKGIAVNKTHSTFHKNMVDNICHNLKSKEQLKLNDLLIKVKDFFN